MIRYILCIVILLLPLTAQAQNQKPVFVLNIDGAISPAYADYLSDRLDQAETAGAQLVLIELNTPGGLLTSTREMVADIIDSSVPVAVYVTPSGAHAASAGTFILMAAHIAAMDEGTNIGAATPVQMGGGPMSPENDSPAQENQNSNQKDVREKTIEDTAAFMRGIAEMRERNADWAEEAVTKAKSITAREAYNKNVIDLIATTRTELLSEIDGRSVQLKNGQQQTLKTEQAPVLFKGPDLVTRLLALISDPNVAAILMMIGIYGLLMEFYAPGSMIPGTIGAISLLLALYAFSILPVNGLGALLILVGLLFMVAETFAPSFGILGFGGIAAFAIGLMILFDSSQMMGIGLEWGVIAGLIFSALIIMGIAFALFVKSAIDREQATGPESLVGREATVVDWKGHEGHVDVQGERWQAYAPESELEFSIDQEVLISAVDGLKLKVRYQD